MGNFPDIPKAISDYLFEEEGNITRNKLLMVGSLSIVMSVIFALEVDAGHKSHESHESHTSHGSGSHSSGHSNHGSHSSHSSSAAHSSHGSSSHSNHSNNAASHINRSHHGSHHSHSSHRSGAIPRTTSVPTPQRMDEGSLPSSIILPQILNAPNIPSVPNVPDTVAPTFSMVEATALPEVEKE